MVSIRNKSYRLLILLFVIIFDFYELVFFFFYLWGNLRLERLGNVENLKVVMKLMKLEFEYSSFN